MSFRNRPRTSHAVSCADEAAHLAHAVAYVLRTLTVKQVENFGEDLLALVHEEIPLRAAKVSAASVIGNASIPLNAAIRNAAA